MGILTADAKLNRHSVCVPAVGLLMVGDGAASKFNLPRKELPLIIGVDRLLRYDQERR